MVVFLVVGGRFGDCGGSGVDFVVVFGGG